VALVVLACVGEPDPEGNRTTWLVDSVPAIDIAASDPHGDVVLIDPVGGTVLSNGTIVIADRWGAAVHFFDARGVLVRSVGRRGAGPGEFSSLSWLGQCGEDSVVVWDGALGRATEIDQLGQIGRQYPIPTDPAMDTPPTFLTCSRHGTIAYLGTPSGYPARPGEFADVQAPLAIADADGQVTHQLGDVPAWDGRWVGRLTSIALSADYLYVGTAESAAVDAYRLNGKRQAIVPVPVAPRPPTRYHLERAVDALVMALGNRDERARMRRLMLERGHLPEYLPPYSALLTDPRGTLWVVLSVSGDPDTRLRGLDHEGRVVADLRVPADVKVFEVGHNYLLTLLADVDGQPHVALYRFARAR
jgi:hypothetical protein